MTLKTIASYRDLPLAELAKAQLESENIYCFLANKNHIGMNWLYSFALGGVKVQVRQEDAEEAIQILNSDNSDDLKDIESSLPPIEQQDLCDNCGSANILVVNMSRKAGAWSLLLGLPLLLFGKRYKCKDCGYKIKRKST
jgi:Putative prokaryotic signal transducing protein